MNRFQTISLMAKNKDGEETEFLLLVNKDEFDKIPADEQKKILTDEIQHVSINKSFIITKSIPSYSFVDTSGILKECDYGNTIIEANLPYCLHIPNNYTFYIKIDEKRTASVTLQKYWTQKTKDSSSADFFSKDKKTYFVKSSFISPNFPLNPNSGWEQEFIGTNVEKEKDGNATFRYTKVIIQFNTDYEDSDLSQDKFNPTINQISDTSLNIVNKLINVYRYLAKEEFVESLGSLSINNIYFSKHNIGFYIFSMGHGIGDAIMNHSLNKIEAMADMLKKDIKPPLHQLLMFDAQASINKKSFPIAVVKIYQSLEIFLEAFIYEGYTKLGLADVDIEKILIKKWQTKDRLKNVLKEITGKNLLEEDGDLWDKWCTDYDKVRNEVVHKGKEINFSDAKESFEINMKVVDCVSSFEVKSDKVFKSSFL